MCRTVIKATIVPKYYERVVHLRFKLWGVISTLAGWSHHPLLARLGIQSFDIDNLHWGSSIQCQSLKWNGFMRPFIQESWQISGILWSSSGLLEYPGYLFLPSKCFNKLCLVFCFNLSLCLWSHNLFKCVYDPLLYKIQKSTTGDIVWLAVHIEKNEH